ncbi:MAG: fumarylacetoacetate hydrolase family protein [Humibacillus sp.]|nr:fumarylacetoacetate hydrolase family protein [Humibacillus sp.]MDN5777309.1 fumarylacetoacetate hydrolase family protein [Humibacillus sp.]
MRLARVGAVGSERPVVVTADGSLLDLRPLTHDVDGAFLQHGLESVARAVEAGALPALSADETTGIRFGVPVARPGKVVGIGLNYQCYAADVGVPVPTEPVVFLKASSALCGPTDPIRLIPGSTTTDYEVELAVVIGRQLRDASAEEALAGVAGYGLANDLSDRDLQLERGGTWTKGKSADTYCPLGPWFVTPDELGDPQNLPLRLDVNGVRRQSGTTADMVFGIGDLLAYVSGIMTLEPGDVVITGTPAGVAVAAAEPRPYLRDGDLVEIDGGVLGRHVSAVHASRPKGQ